MPIYFTLFRYAVIFNTSQAHGQLLSFKSLQSPGNIIKLSNMMHSVKPLLRLGAILGLSPIFQLVVADTVPAYGQCGGSGFASTSACASGSYCQSENAYYCTLIRRSSPPRTVARLNFTCPLQTSASLALQRLPRLQQPPQIPRPYQLPPLLQLQQAQRVPHPPLKPIS